MKAKTRRIKSFIKSDRGLHTAILKAMVRRKWSNKDLIEVCFRCGYKIAPSMLSVYLKHGGNHVAALSDQSLMFITIVLGIDMTVRCNHVEMSDKFIHEKMEYFFPKSLYPELSNSGNRLSKFYNDSGILF